jgi:acid phosphatase
MEVVMRQVVFILALSISVVLVSCTPAEPPAADSSQPPATAPAVAGKPEPAATLSWPAGLPVYDHVVIVVEENKDYAEIIGSDAAPYINNVLKAEGANLTQAFGEEHYSQGNYFWLFSGDNQGVGFEDKIPDSSIPGYPFETPNLGSQLIAKGLTFKGYAESLPAIGSTVDETRDESGTWIYARKHVPWISFANVPDGTTVETSSNLRFADFPAPGDYDQLPTVAFVIPNLENDMHNGAPKDSIPAGDRWLKENLDSYYQWAKENNSLLILTFDEDNDRRGYKGLTDPATEIPEGQSCKSETRSPELEDACEMQNNIVTIIAGAHVKPGDYDEGRGITHVNILRTLEAMYGLPKAGAQQPNAAKAGISDDYIITDIFETVQ